MKPTPTDPWDTLTEREKIGVAGFNGALMQIVLTALVSLWFPFWLAVIIVIVSILIGTIVMFHD
jgi:hypothetical protein